MPAPDTTEILLGQILRAIEALPARIADAIESQPAISRPTGRLHSGDEEKLTRLLPVIAEEYGAGRVFAVRDLFALRSEPMAAELRRAFGTRRAAMQAGQLFRRAIAARFSVNGLRMARSETAREGALWIVQQDLAGLNSH